MKFTKTFVSFQNQIDRLEKRGLLVEDLTTAIHFLETNSYYRLRAYTYPFQDNEHPDHPFVKKVSFNEIISLYEFDSKIRKLLFLSLEKIEIALRTQIIYHFAATKGSHWQLDPTLFRDTAKFAKHLQSLNEEIQRSDETFIKHYAHKYDEPSQPPAWMSLEVASFGLLSKIYQNIKDGTEKQNIASYFGHKKVKTLENWMFCFSNLRNICAHHGRVWNRRFASQPFLPYNNSFPFFTKAEIAKVYTNKLYAVVCCLYYMLKRITPHTDFKLELIQLMQTCPLTQEKEMGFPKGWQDFTLWKQ